MKFSKKRHQYEASNVSFNANTMKAFSYDWWQFVALVNGQVVFNNYNYSNATCKHQQKVRRIMSELNIEIDLEVSCPKGLHHEDAIQSIVDVLNSDIRHLNNLMNAPRSHKAKNAERKETIESLKAKMFKALSVYKSPLQAALTNDLSV